MDETDRRDARTSALTPNALAELRAVKRARSGQGQAALLIYHRDGVQTVPLREERPVVIGRSAPADVAIRDTSLSRQHACVELIEGKIWIEDLASTNGTWIHGKRITREMVEPGSELSLGAVTASVHALAPVEGDEQFGHDAFQRELTAEARRAGTFDRRLTLLMLRTARRDHGGLSRWFAHVRSQLRSFERIALYSPDTVEVLLPELGEEDAKRRARALVLASEPLVCGLGVFPDHAGSDGELLEVTRAALRRATLADQISVAPRTLSPKQPAPQADQVGMVIRSPAMKKLYVTVERLGASVIPVLLLGETGTGKEVVTRAIHDGGKRHNRPLICVNCAAIPDQLVESTLFGHEKGSFTGADRRAKGVFESADGGTVMLDEVGELPAQAQAALLRVLETKSFSRVGSNKEQEVDVRVIAATHRDLESMTTTGAFREDLYYRLNTMTLPIPPLRERTEEIEPLARHFIGVANEANECQVKDLTPQALDLLMRHDWPGNVRELRNAMERAVVLAYDMPIEVEDLPDRVRKLDAYPTSDTKGSASGTTFELHALQRGTYDGEINLRSELQRIEHEMIRRALKQARWDRKAAASRLGLPLRTLARKIKDLGIDE